MKRIDSPAIPDAGFTLVELLVALTLLSLISVMLVGTLRFGHAAWQRADAATDRLQRTELAVNVARRLLQQAYPLPVAGVGRPRAVAFSGSADSIAFLAPPAAALSLGGLQLTWLTIEPDEGDARLVLRSRRFDRASETWPPVSTGGEIAETVLARHVDGARFAYFGADANSPEAPPRWYGDWNDAAELPDLVLLSDAAGVPDMVAALRLGGSTGLVQLTRAVAKNE